jgi:putative NADH-flavin reductase
MKIVVFGASRGVGRQLVELALNEGHSVTAAVRDPDSIKYGHEKLRVVGCDVLDYRAVCEALLEQDAVFCTLGGPRHGVTLYSEAARNVVSGMQHVGVKRIVFLSNFGVLGETGKGLLSAPLVALAKLVIADTLRDHRNALDILRCSGLQWSAVRPMPLTDGPWTGNYRVSMSELPAGGRSISRSDVADLMLRCATSDEYLFKIPGVAY